MIKKSIRKEIDKVIKNIWLRNICTDYGNGFLIKEASLQCSLYHHLQNELNFLLQQNHLYIYPEFYFKELKFFADLVIVEMDMTLEKKWLSEKMTDIAAIIELKYDGGNAMSTSDYIKTDMPKLKEYIRSLNYDCQYYFGVIYETDCEWLHWFDKRSTNNWANGRLTELNAGYLGETMYFEVNSYNNMNFEAERYEDGSFNPSTIKISFKNSLLNHKLGVYMKARELQENLLNDTERFSSEEEHQRAIEALSKDLDAVKQSILDDSKIVKKGVRGISVKIYPENE